MISRKERDPGTAQTGFGTSATTARVASRRPDYDSAVDRSATARSDFLESLMDTELYSMGAFFCDEHPDLVDEVVESSAAIEERGILAYAADHESSAEETFETLLTGLAVRYYKAVAG